MANREMTSKEALEVLFTSYYYDGNYEDVIKARQKLEQDLDRLEKLEIANKNNEGLVRENVDLINRNLKLQDENANVKQAIKILKEKNHIQLLYDNEHFTIPIINIGENYDYLTQEEYKLLKEVLEEE